MANLVWFRTDLRIHDQPALSAAANDQSTEVLAVFIATPVTWRRHDAAPLKIDFIYRNLQSLSARLSEYNIPLIVLECADFNSVSEVLLSFCEQHKVKALYFNEQYEFDERKRDNDVEQRLQTKEIKVYRFHDQVLIPPGMVLSANGEPLKVYTAFKKKWLSIAREHISFHEAKIPVKQKATQLHSSALPVSKTHNMLQELWPAGEDAAVKRLEDFLYEKVHHYHSKRDFPALNGTSQLSPYLTQGVLSVRKIYNGLHQLQMNEGENTWLNELIWRDFFKHAIYLFPKLACHQTIKGRFQNWPWKKDELLFKAWQEGQTGFPFIDAGMRQLKAIGWMHNRLRLNTAMFLTKLMNVDWQSGERHFMQYLIDGDLAANNGNWKWCAGTGFDAAPYFRIFNPTTQSEKFDPHGEFIRQYCPELKNFSDCDIHAPHTRNPKLAMQTDYPAPIIDYANARQNALKTGKLLKSNNNDFYSN